MASDSKRHSTPRADVLAEEYRGTYLWEQLDKAKARIADLEEQLRSAETTLAYAEEFIEHQDMSYRWAEWCEGRNPASTEGLPPDLARVLRDPSITIDRDYEIRLADGRTLFEHLQQWRNAPSNTASADLSDDSTPAKSPT